MHAEAIPEIGRRYAWKGHNHLIQFSEGKRFIGAVSPSRLLSNCAEGGRLVDADHASVGYNPGRGVRISAIGGEVDGCAR